MKQLVDALERRLARKRATRQQAEAELARCKQELLWGRMAL